MSIQAASANYCITGKASNLHGPLELPGHDGMFFVFSFVAMRPTSHEPEDNTCEFCLDVRHADVRRLISRVFGSMLDQVNPITVHFSEPPLWDGVSAPSYIVTDIA